MLALTRLEPACHYAALVDGMEAIQATPLRFRSALMCEFASRMVPLEDGNGAIPWLYYLRLCESQLTSHGTAPESGALLRNLCIVQPGAMMCMLRGPMRSVTRVYSWEAQVSLLPKHYRSDLYHALLRLNAVAGGCDGQVWRLIDAGGRDEKCVPLHFIGVMAALQLFDDKAQDVRRRFIARFPLCAQDHGRAFDAIVVGAFACCFPQRCDELQKILLRWDEDYSALLPALHASLLQKAAKILSRRWGTLEAPDLTDRPLPRHVAPSDHVLAIPATGEADLAIVQSSMATFWTLYWVNDRGAWGESSRPAWDTVLRLPWQVQPTLLARLIGQNGLARVNLAQWWGKDGSLHQWEQNIMANCIASDRPRLAVRALMVAISLSRVMAAKVQLAILERALAVATDTLPPWSWNELIEGLCVFCVETKRTGEWNGSFDARIATALLAFLSDDATCMLAPSPMFVATLIDHAELIWTLFRGSEDEARFERLWDRLDLLQSDRESIMARLRALPEAAFK
ncbi:hypothetical protein [Robbsia sp. KACC 23696]|uniref:hypothetical protein n=1 Tax=Robbsia sp. KACC 23696 TaxID=3149231 RepID=UPI00325ACA94